VQELLLARQIRIHVSNASFGVDHLMEVIGDRQTSHIEDLGRVLAYTKSRELDQLDSPRHLHDLVLEFGTCQCQDPRDKVFALMSLVSQDDKWALGPFLPDYSLTHDALVAIALSHFKEHHHLAITDTSHDIFEGLGVGQSRYIRRRLLAASDGLWLYDDPASLNGIDFRQINFHELADDSAEAHAQDEQPEGTMEKTASRLWWFLTGCGLFQITSLYGSSDNRGVRTEFQPFYLDFDLLLATIMLSLSLLEVSSSICSSSSSSILGVIAFVVCLFFIFLFDTSFSASSTSSRISFLLKTNFPIIAICFLSLRSLRTHSSSLAYTGMARWNVIRSRARPGC